MTGQVWEGKKAVERYLKEAEAVIPCRQEMMSTIAGLAVDGTSDSPTIMDLASGTGDLTAMILSLRPGASMELVDLNDEMIKLSRERFKDNPRVHITSQNLNQGLPDLWNKVKFDSMVSTVSLHYIDPQNRVKLYSAIRSLLKEGGVFINGDVFICDCPRVDRWEYDRRINWMVPQMKEKLGQETNFDELKSIRLEYRRSMGEKPGTIWEMYNDLKEAGFQHVDCLWKNQCFAIMAAVK